MKQKISIFWFRRDLRLEDNAGLLHALNASHPVLPIFIFDTGILGALEDKSDRRVDYIHQALSAINTQLQAYGARLNTYIGRPLDIFKELMQRYELTGVYCNRDYEPKAIARDKEIYHFLLQQHIDFKAYKDQVIFDKNDILKKDNTPYSVYSPYARSWKARLSPEHYACYTPKLENFVKQPESEILSLEDIGFKKTDISYKKPQLLDHIIDSYDLFRDYPAKDHTSRLGIALRFGTISIRRCVAYALKHNQTWLSELIWREFFMQILYHFPHSQHEPFKASYRFIPWRNNPEEFERWCSGNTGYPIVDAGMRELNATGFMHNRIRMITASFLCKHLLIDWRWGEAYFASKLDDYDLAANVGNWQWASSTGCDAAPYFRFFSPQRQTERFDKDLEYIKKWVPEFLQPGYPQPIVEHSLARNRMLETYKKGLQQAQL